MHRRNFLSASGLGLAALVSRRFAPPWLHTHPDEHFLEDLQKRCFRYFFEQFDRHTGLIRDHARANNLPYPADQRSAANVTVTGFGLAGYCIAAERGWIGRATAEARVLVTLRFFADWAAHRSGWFYHWLDQQSGERSGAIEDTLAESEISTIDSAFLLAGVLTVRQYFRSNPEIVVLANRIYERVDFTWMMEKSLILCHGWTPERGFIMDLWSEYSEASLLYLLAIGSPSHPIPPRAWYAWRRNPNVYGPYRFIGSAPLFTQQYSHAFVDFRYRREGNGTGVDWFENSITATRAHRQFCLDLAKRFPGYSSEIWGLTCSFGPQGYIDWGGPPLDPRTDGTVVPCAAGGSLMFASDICLPALRAMKERFGAQIYGRYGFVDAFNPVTGWVAEEVQGLNLGIMLLSAENLRTGNVWRWFMSGPEAQRALELAEIRLS